MAITSARPWLGQRALDAAIVFYQRRVSGRGPLRRVRCTFGGCESCSAYGLRMVRHHARSLPHAVRLIVRRIARCGTSSVHRDGRALLWGQDYDRLDQVDTTAAELHERPGTRRALLLAAIGLARYRGERRILPRLLERLRALAAVRLPRERIPLRDGRRRWEHLRGRWIRGVLPSLGLAALSLCLPLGFALSLGAVAVLLGAGCSRRYLEQRRRLGSQLRRARFSLA